MGLTSVIKNAVSAGFSAVGDVKITATFTSVNSNSYNATTGAVSETTTDYGSINGIRRDYTSREIFAGIAKAGDVLFIVQQDDVGFSLETVDRVTISGTVYQIVSFTQDAVSATYRIQLRS